MKQKLPVFLTAIEKERVLASDMSDRDRAIVSLFLYAGLRCNELRMLDIDDIDFDSMMIHVRHGKRDKERFVPLHTKAAKALDQHLTGHPLAPDLVNGPVFTSRLGQRISLRRLRSLIKGAGKNAGLVKDLHPHSLRHTFAVSLMDVGVNLETIRELLGHADIRTTSIYLHCSMAGKRSAVDLL